MTRTSVVGSLLVALGLGISGCATIAKGTSQSITVSTNVEGAEVFLDGVLIGRTPFVGPVKKNKSQLRIELDGYRTETLQLSKSLDPMFWGNIIIGGTLGSITDFASGAAYQYAPAAYQVDLQRGDQSDEDFRHEVAVRKFSMLFIDEIASDLSNGGGDYLEALVHIIAAPEVTTADIGEALTTSSGDAIRFGQSVVDLR
jgi:hypothetical protein